MVVVQLTVDNYFRKKIVFLFDSRSGKVFPINGGSQALWIIKIRKNNNVIIEKTDKQRKKQKKKANIGSKYEERVVQKWRAKLGVSLLESQLQQIQKPLNAGS